MHLLRFLTVACLSVVIWLLSGVSIQAQPNQPLDTVTSIAGIELVSSVDKAEIYVGDLITYTVSITYDSTFEMQPPPLGANLGAFEIKDYQADIVTRLDDGRIKNDNVFVISTFTTGDYVIPGIPVLFLLPDSSRRVLLTEPMAITIRSLLAEGDDSTDVRPLKGPYEFARDLTKYYLWGAAALLVICVTALLLWRRWRKRGEASDAIDLRPPWEIAFEKLANLKRQRLPAEARFKEYYIDLSETAREYLGRIHNITVLDMTTEEFLSHFKQTEAPDGAYSSVAAFLQHADLVKFARHIPLVERTESDFEQVYGLVKTIRVDYELRQAKLTQEAGPTKADESEVTS